jgi:hypothetical protein
VIPARLAAIRERRIDLIPRNSQTLRDTRKPSGGIAACERSNWGCWIGIWNNAA